MTSPRRAFPLRLPPLLRARLEAMAERDGMSLNRLLCIILTQWSGLPRSVLRERASKEQEPVLQAKAEELVKAGAALQPMPARNAPCPCGSGRKSKRCCYSD